MGHSVFEAEDARSGLTTLRKRSIDLLFADVGLSGQSSNILAAEVQTIQPGLSIVFATGLVHMRRPGDANCGIVVLRKPYEVENIATALSTARR